MDQLREIRTVLHLQYLLNIIGLDQAAEDGRVLEDHISEQVRRVEALLDLFLQYIVFILQL